MKDVTAEQLGSILFNMHQHEEDGSIIYYEDDVIELLKKLGYPEPVFGKTDFKLEDL